MMGDGVYHPGLFFSVHLPCREEGALYLRQNRTKRPMTITDFQWHFLPYKLATELGAKSVSSLREGDTDKYQR